MYYAILYKSLRKIHIRYTEMVYKLELLTYIKIHVPQYTRKIKEKYVDILHSFTHLIMNVLKNILNIFYTLERITV